MLPVFICDDDKEALQRIVEVVENYIVDYNAESMRIVCAVGDPFELLRSISERHQRAVYLLDVDLHKRVMDGIMLAREIRKRDPRAYIAHITAHAELQQRANDQMTETMRYIIKDAPNADSQIRECLNNARCLQKQVSINTFEKQKFHIAAGNRVIVLPPEDVYSICSVPKKSHCIEIRTKQDAYQYSGVLSDIIRDLDYTFFRCHKSCIVGLTHVTQIDRVAGSLLLDNGSSVPCSRRLYRDVESCLRELPI